MAVYGHTVGQKVILSVIRSYCRSYGQTVGHTVIRPYSRTLSWLLATILNVLRIVVLTIEPTRCENPNDPNLKRQLPSKRIGDYVRYQCREGFTPTDGGQATCTENGWTPNPLLIPSCNLPTTVENADITEKIQEVYNHGAEVTYACRTNYRMEGERTIRCRRGQWMTCQLPQVNGNTYPGVNKEIFLPGETVWVKCNQGCWFSYKDRRTQKTITCAGSGQWDTAAICQGRQHYFRASISCGCINVLRIVVLISEPTRSSQSFRFDWIGVFF
uniref:Sushi domain-containing protein n=1 Tax=Gadus morhua TaxID=8049 RepID=A0A8C4ZF27_GADMO